VNLAHFSSENLVGEIMRKFILATGMLLTAVSAVNADTVGAGYFEGEFSSVGLIGTDPAMYGEFREPYGQSYTDMDGNAAYRWGVWTDLEGNYRWSDNYLSFSGNTFSEQAQGETFAAGILSFGNGVSWIDSNPDSAVLKVESFGDSSDFSQQLFDEIEIFSTPNQDGNGNLLSQAVAADLIYFTEEFKEFGAFRVLVGEVGAVELLYEFNSLHFKGFG
jgi:hypothetical protein